MYSLTPTVVCSTWRPHFNCDLVENDLIALLQADHQYSNKPSFSLAATSVRLLFFLTPRQFLRSKLDPLFWHNERAAHKLRYTWTLYWYHAKHVSYVVGLYRYEEQAEFCGHPELPELQRSSLVTYSPTDLVLLKKICTFFRFLHLLWKYNIIYNVCYIVYI